MLSNMSYWVPLEKHHSFQIFKPKGVKLFDYISLIVLPFTFDNRIFLKPKLPWKIPSYFYFFYFLIVANPEKQNELLSRL